MPGWLWKVFLAGCAAASCVFAFLPPAVAHRWAVAMVAVATCVMVAAVWLRRPKRPLPWWLFAAAGAAFAAMYTVGTPPAGAALSPGRSAVGNVLYLAGYLFVVSGGVLVLHYRVGHRDKVGLLDGAIVGCAVAVAMWVLISQPALVRHPGQNVFDIATYPVFSAFCSAIALRLLLANGWRCVPLWLLFLAATNDTLGNALVSAHDQTLIAPPLGWLGVLWLSPYAPLCAAFLHPALNEVSEPVDSSDLTHSSSRLFVLGIALLVAPAVVLFEARDVLAGSLASAGALGLVLLVTVRLGRIVRQWERARADADRRAALQAAVVGLGRMALRSHEMPALVAECSEVVSRSLGREVRIGPADATSGNDTGLRFGPAGEYAIGLADPAPVSTDERMFLEAVTLVLGGAADRHRAEDEIRYRALHDELTGLPNRALLFEHLAKASARAGRTGMPVAVLFTDLDGFKSVNDTYGHAAGDDLLIGVADAIVTAVRAHDTVARIAGDEFVTICEGVTPEDAEQVAERIRAVIAEPFVFRGHELRVTASVGVTLADPGFDPDAVLRSADEDMYRAKRAARQAS